MGHASATLNPAVELPPVECRQQATTSEWLADLEHTFNAVVIALDGGLLPAAVIPEHKAGRLGILLERGEWKATVEAASRHITRNQQEQHPSPQHRKP